MADLIELTCDGIGGKHNQEFLDWLNALRVVACTNTTIGFMAVKDGTPQSLVAQSVSELITFSNTEFNLGGHFDTSMSAFLVPLEGLYAFGHTHNRTIGASEFAHVVSRFRVDGLLTKISAGFYHDNGSISIPGVVFKYLMPGQIVQSWASISHPTLRDIDGGNHETYFYGALISEVRP